MTLCDRDIIRISSLKAREASRLTENGAQIKTRGRHFAESSDKEEVLTLEAVEIWVELLYLDLTLSP
jgi:hypothetical protein